MARRGPHESARKWGVIKTFDEGSTPRSAASLERGEGARSRPESGRLAAARPVAIGVGSDHLLLASNVCSYSVASMMLAGLNVPDDDVRELARLVDEPTATMLRNGIDRETVVLALTIDDRERILRALDDRQTDALAELRGVLLTEHEWRRREGLV